MELVYHRPAMFGEGGMVYGLFGHEHLTYGGFFIPSHVGRYAGMIKFDNQPDGTTRFVDSSTDMIKFDNSPDGRAREI